MKLITLGFLLVLIGILVILAGMIIMIYQTLEKPETSVRGGGVIMIGPIPIIFGTDVAALKLVMIFAIVLMVIATLLFFINKTL